MHDGQIAAIRHETPRRFAMAAGVCVLSVAVLTLLGWAQNIVTLKSLAPGLITMKVNTACALLAAALSLVLQTVGQPRPARIWAARALALLPLVIGVLTLIEHTAHVDLGIDELLMRVSHTAADGALSGARMARATALCCVLSGLVLVLLDLRAAQVRTLVPILCLAVCGVAGLAGIGYAFWINELSAPGEFTPMALHSAASFMLLASGCLAARDPIAPLRVRNWPMRVKIVLLMLVVLLAPFLFFALLEIRAAASQLLEAEAALLGARAEQIASELDEFQRYHARAAAQLAASAAAAGCCQEQDARGAQVVDTMLKLQLTEDPELFGAAIVDLQGKIAFASSPRMLGIDVAQYGAVRSALAGVAMTSELHFERLGDGEQPVIAYLAPVRAVDGAFQGVAALWVRASALWERMSRANHLAGPDSFAVLLDQDGVRLAHTTNREGLFRPTGALDPDVLASAVLDRRFGERTQALLSDVRPFPEQFARATAAAPDGALFRGWAPLSNAYNYGVARRLQTMPWTVFYMGDEATLRQRLAPHVRNRALIAVLISTLALGVGMLFTTGNLRRLQAISAAAARIAAGELSTRVVVPSGDELGELGERFNNMAARLEAQAAVLNNVNAALEQRVQERTAALTESEQNLAITLDSIGDAVIATDETGRVERMNPVAERLTGWPLSEAKGKPLDEIFVILNESTREPVMSPVTRVLRDGLTVALANHTVLVCRDGGECPIADSAAPIFDAEQRLRGVVLVLRDVRDQYAAEDALRASEARYRELYETHPDMCATVEYGTDKIIECNQTLAQRLGYDKSELIGMPVIDLYEAPMFTQREADRGTFLRLGEFHDRERVLKCKDGRLFAASVSVTATQDGQGRVLAKCVWRDISVRKQADRDQQFMVELSELQHLSADPVELASNVCRRLAQYLGAARSCFMEVDLATDSFTIRDDYHGDVPSMAGEHSISFFGTALRDEQRAAKTTVVDDTAKDPRTAEAYELAYRRATTGSAICVPLLHEGRWIASLSVARKERHDWSAREIALVQGVAERSWLWIEHARLATRLRDAAARELNERSEQRFRALLDGVKEYAIYLLDTTGHISTWNGGAQRLKGYSESEVIGKHLSMFYTPEDQKSGKVQVALAKAVKEGRYEEEGFRVRKDGSRFWANVLITPLYDQDGKLEAFAKVTRDHSERRRTDEALRVRQEQLSASLKEREVLLQEVHHRVKNNLQVISSLLNMQMRQIADSQTRNALEECKTRVEAIALIHEKLYQSRDYANVPFSEYVRSLAHNVFHAAGISPANVKLEVEVEPVALAVDKAIPCGLILSELITNTLKHAFPANRNGKVHVTLRKLDHKLLLAVADNGVGMPQDFDVETSQSLGMQLVTTLVEQVHGQLEITRGEGTAFRIEVPMEAAS